MLSIDILVQAVVVAHTVLKDERRGPHLALRVAARQEVLQPVRVAHLQPHALVPEIGHRRQAQIQLLAQALQQRWQGLVEILVLAAPETVACHDDAGAKAVLPCVESGQVAALLRIQQAAQARAALLIELVLHLRPVAGRGGFASFVVEKTEVVHGGGGLWDGGGWGSEEGRVGEEGRSRGAPDHLKKKKRRNEE